jgi:hypothetical protein
MLKRSILVEKGVSRDKNMRLWSFFDSRRSYNSSRNLLTPFHREIKTIETAEEVRP